MIDKNDNWLKIVPKVELHVHLDGSLNKKSIKEKYKLSDKEIQENLIANEKCDDLNDYLKKFKFSISIMQTKKELKNAVIDLLNLLKSQNVIYAEIRFAPQFHTSKELNQEDVVKCVIEAKNQVDIKSNFILCCMRGENNDKENNETIEIAKKYLGKGVCGVDLAGAEALYKTFKYKNIFKKICQYKIPFTIHAGEADGPDSVKCAINYGAKRIGHGVRAIEDEALVEQIIKNDIYLEICVTSNIQTKIYNNYSEHPIEKLYKMGVKTTINTDNMTVSNTCLANEYYNILNSTNLTKEDIIKMNENAIKCAFISDEEKEQLLEILKK